MSAVSVSLREWETLTPDHCGKLAGRRLDSEASRKLVQQLAGRIEILELARGIELRATSFVGRFMLGEVTVTVHPKISGGPFLNLLRYAYGLRKLDLYQLVGHTSETWAFQDLLVHQFATEATELLARGIHRDYEQTFAELVNPRGRIEFKRLVGVAHLAKAVLPCIYHPRSEDNVLNQVLLAGLRYASGLTTDNVLRWRLGHLTKTLGETVSIKRLDTILLVKARRTMDRRTSTYEPVLALIKLLFQGKGVSLEGEGTPIRLPGFLFDMNRFFQTLLSRFLHDHLEGYEIQDEFHLKELFCYDTDRNPLGREAPTQKPDFVIWKNRQISTILDAKYRDLWENKLPRHMLYQLALYALGQKSATPKAVILYPTLIAESRDQAIIIRDPVSGKPQGEVILRPVDLLKLEKLLREGDGNGRSNFAYHLAFGCLHHPASATTHATP